MHHFREDDTWAKPVCAPSHVAVQFADTSPCGKGGSGETCLHSCSLRCFGGTVAAGNVGLVQPQPVLPSSSSQPLEGATGLTMEPEDNQGGLRGPRWQALPRGWSCIPLGFFWCADQSEDWFVVVLALMCLLFADSPQTRFYLSPFGLSAPSSSIQFQDPLFSFWADTGGLEKSRDCTRLPLKK